MSLGMEILTIGILFSVIIFLCVVQVMERRDHAKIVNEITNKLIARSFSEYATFNGQRVVDKDKPERPVVVPDPVLGNTY